MTDRDFLTIVLKDVNRKLDLVLDAYAEQKEEMNRRFARVDEQHEELKAAIRFTNVDLREKIGKVEDRLTTVESRLDSMEGKLDAVADDLAAHRADTESHAALYRVKE